MDPVTIALAVSTGLSFLGSVQQSRQLRRAARADKIRRKTQAVQQNIAAKERAEIILSEKRAAQAARGIAMGEASSLLESNMVLNNLNDTLYWIEKGLVMDLDEMDFRLAGALTKEAYNRGINLMSGIANTYYISKQLPKETGPNQVTANQSSSLMGSLGSTDLAGQV